jgi:tetratricopeptide (TPR) repeat protein
MSRVFLSYCRDDIAEVSYLRKELVAEGFEVWWDNDLLPGQDWKYEIRQAMKESDAVIICLSARSVDRTRSYARSEILEAIAAYRQRRPGEIFLIPVRLSQCEIPSIEIDDTRTLDRLHCVDLFPANRWEGGIRKVVESIRSGSPAPPRAAPPAEPARARRHPQNPPRLAERVKARGAPLLREVFLSYSSKDKAIGEEMCSALEREGIPCWIAPRDIVPGKRYTAQIIDAIVASRVFVLIFSSSSNVSEHVIREVEKAVRQRIPIIPFRIENVAPTKDMDYLISISQWFDACAPPLEDHFRVLAATLRAILDGKAEPIQVPPPPRPRRSGILVGACLTIAAIALVGLVAAAWFSPARLPTQRDATPIGTVAGGQAEQKAATSDGASASRGGIAEQRNRPETPQESVAGSSPVTEKPVQKIGPDVPKSDAQMARAAAHVPDVPAKVSKLEPDVRAPQGPAESPPAIVERTALNLFDEGTRLFGRKQLEKALPKLLESVNLLKSIDDRHPKLAQVSKVLGDFYYTRREYREAINAYTDAIQCQDSAAARHARGLAYRNSRQPQHALADFDRAIHLDASRGTAALHLDRANLLAAMGSLVAAGLSYEKACRLDPRNARALYDWGRACAKAGNPRQAISKFNEAMKLDSDPEFFIDRGRAFCDLGKENAVLGEYARAIEDFGVVIDGQHARAEVYLFRGNAYWLNYNDRMAISDYTEAIRRTPTGPKMSVNDTAIKQQAYLGRSRAHFRRGEVEQALQDVTVSLGIDPRDRLARTLARDIENQRSLQNIVK